MIHTLSILETTYRIYITIKKAFDEKAIGEIADRVWAIVQNPSELSGFNGCLVAAVCLEVGKRLGVDFNSGEADAKLYKGATRDIRAISAGILEKSFYILSGLAKSEQKPKKQDILKFEAEVQVFIAYLRNRWLNESQEQKERDVLVGKKARQGQESAKNDFYA